MKNGDASPEPAPLRADARRSADALLAAAKDVFVEAGVDAPVRDIARRAGVGVGTLYRRFPQRADLIAAVFRREMDSCADEAATLATAAPPFEALAQWMQRYATFVGTKRGLAAALHSGDPAYAALPAHFEQRLRPACHSLFAAARAAGTVRADVTADDLLHAVTSLCMAQHGAGPEYARRMVDLLVAGLRTSERT